MNRGIGKGKIINKNDVITYVGTMPFSIGDKVVILKDSDLELILKAEVELLKAKKIEMPKTLYDVNDENRSFADEIGYIAADGTEYKLFLDRFLYGINFKDEMWIRYTNVDVSLIEEGPSGENQTR